MRHFVRYLAVPFQFITEQPDLWNVRYAGRERVAEHRHLTIDLVIKCHRSMLIPFKLYLAAVIELILYTQTGEPSTT